MDLLGIGGNANIKPMACQCSTANGFTNARGDDGCFHCGCSCKTGSNVNAGNSDNATWTIRKSGIWE